MPQAVAGTGWVRLAPPRCPGIDSAICRVPFGRMAADLTALITQFSCHLVASSALARVPPKAVIEYNGFIL
jgi:hypothetical protein